MCDIHRFIFKDIYPFAGELREEDIAKGNFRFASVEFLVNQTNQLLNELKQDNYLKNMPVSEFINKLTYYLTELNVLHPFREGNGRAQREFIRCLGLESGYLIDWTAVDPKTILSAMILSPINNTELRNVFNVLLKNRSD
ncbi:Fic/DOC family protein [Paenibacillus phocaensis]|uniref:Fic/DOC family protein n=1 Tax=Paenibacillus phocaensis TaxID=1776378 RepID=UPI000839C4F2|nr:Fic family protein [Paenibacillus phocaensis]